MIILDWFLTFINLIGLLILFLSGMFILILPIAGTISTLLVDGYKRFLNNFWNFNKKLFKYLFYAFLIGLIIVIPTYSSSVINPNSKINKNRFEQYQVEKLKQKQQADKQEKINQKKIQNIRAEQKQLYTKFYQTKDDNKKAELHVQIDKNNQKISNLEN